MFPDARLLKDAVLPCDSSCVGSYIWFLGDSFAPRISLLVTFFCVSASHLKHWGLWGFWGVAFDCCLHSVLKFSTDWWVLWGPALEASTMCFEGFNSLMRFLRPCLWSLYNTFWKIEFIDEVFWGIVFWSPRNAFWGFQLIDEVFWGTGFETFTIGFEAFNSLMRFFGALFLKSVHLFAVLRPLGDPGN